MGTGLQLALVEQIAMVLETAGIRADVVSVPPLYLTVHVYSMPDAQDVWNIVGLRDDLRFYRVRSFSDDSYVLMYKVLRWHS